MSEPATSPSLARADQTVTTQLAEDKCVVLDTRNGEYYTFNASASVLWQLLERPQSLQTMAEALVGKYAIAAEDARRDAEAFLAELKSANLLKSA